MRCRLARAALAAGETLAGSSAAKLSGDIDNTSAKAINQGRVGMAARLDGSLYHRRMSGHDHDHDHDHSELGEMDLRVRALETVLTQKGYIDPAALDVLIDNYQTR